MSPEIVKEENLLVRFPSELPMGCTKLPNHSPRVRITDHQCARLDVAGIVLMVGNGKAGHSTFSPVKLAKRYPAGPPQTAKFAVDIGTLNPSPVIVHAEASDRIQLGMWNFPAPRAHAWGRMSTLAWLRRLTPQCSRNPPYSLFFHLD